MLAALLTNNTDSPDMSIPGPTPSPSPRHRMLRNRPRSVSPRLFRRRYFNQSRKNSFDINLPVFEKINSFK